MQEPHPSGEKKQKKIAVMVIEEKKFSQSKGVIFLLLGAPDFRVRNIVDIEMLNRKYEIVYSHHYLI